MGTNETLRDDDGKEWLNYVKSDELKLMLTTMGKNGDEGSAGGWKGLACCNKQRYFAGVS